VVVSPSIPAQSGQAALARIKGQIGVTCKVLRRSEEQVHLVPINERYESKVVGEDELCWALTVLCHIRLNKP
jgi:SOS-response transcriptional repressor LexA